MAPGFSTILSAIAVLSLLSRTKGCQFYPIGEYLRFVRVPENLPVGGEVLQVDVHPRRNLILQPVDKIDDVDFFKYRTVNKTTISIRLVKSLEDLVDSATPQNVLKFRMVCEYDDGSDTISSYLSVTVYVEDVNDHEPEFIDAPYKVAVDELTPTGITIFKGIQAIDRDKPNTPNSDVQYSILDGNEHGKFALESSHRAAVVLRKPLDYDTGDHQFILTLMASDRGSPPRNSTTTLIVTVNDNDDLNPKFTKDVYRVQIPEFYPITGRRIHQEIKFEPRIHAEDQDRAINASIRYDLIAGNDRHLFSLDLKNGSLFLEKELDVDSLPGSTFTLQIQASQMDNPLKAGIARVEVELLDINDNQPQFEVDVYNISIVENLPNGFSVLQVVATDQDQGDNGEFIYHLVDPSQAFSIDSHSGWLTVRNQAKLDRETKPSLGMRVYAREKLPSVVSSNSEGDSFVSVEVTLLDANDNNPVFVPTNLYEFSVPSNAPIGQVVGRVEARDPDLGRNGMVLYDLQRGNLSSTSKPLLFSVDAQSGKISVADSPLPPGRHAQFVEASDQPVNPSERRYSLAVVTIEVTASAGDGSKVPDFIGAPYEFWVGSDVPIGTSVGQIRLNNAIDHNKVIYDLLHSYHEGVPFAVEERSGTITVIDEMRKFGRTLYDFEAVVADEKENTLATNVTIHIVESESGVPFSRTSTEPITMEFKVRENLSGALVGQLVKGGGRSKIDRFGNKTSESTRWRNQRFIIASQPDVLEQFAISQDGTIYTQKGLDRETKDTYQLTIIGENGNGIVRGGEIYQVKVHVEDENDNPPMFDRQWYKGSVKENVIALSEVKMEEPIKAKDADINGNAQFKMSLRGEGSELFILDQTTGNLWSRVTQA
ncbi:unnamed protein product [Bemisia tabaci]|uniref:Cadherin domain-containing protein n=1 Tax=Bemisia tabaci TaxID=7038 RepID=A0A9P0EZG9_BEMTA|nr:unnamed protein product [Bemisia tabaci]